MSLPKPERRYPPCGISLMIGMWSLIHTQPAWISRLPRRARWTSLVQTLAAHVKTIVHIGPEPNLVPATFARLSENVVQQMGSRRRLRALSQMAQRPWLSALLPSRAALLRAPFVRQIVLEDWLIENAPR